MTWLDLQNRINLLVEVGKKWVSNGIPENIVLKAKAANPWFDEVSINKSATSIAKQYLSESQLTEWISNYQFTNQTPKQIGLILAGNIPFVGIHDLISVFISGHIALYKPSERDTVLIDYFIESIIHQSEKSRAYFQKVSRLTDYDAVIATGSNTSAKSFEKYFSTVPNIIRRNRNGIAVVYKDSTAESMQSLTTDMLGYYGLGCRSVSKIYMEEGIEHGKIFEAMESQKEIIHHNKYMNNYDYSYALYLLNDEEFYTNDYFIMRPHDTITSRIACAHYEYFDSAQGLEESLDSLSDQIQCIVSDRPLGELAIVPFGKSQEPSLSDYADRVDTLDFLSSI